MKKILIFLIISGMSACDERVQVPQTPEDAVLPGVEINQALERFELKPGRYLRVASHGGKKWDYQATFYPVPDYPFDAVRLNFWTLKNLQITGYNISVGKGRSFKFRNDLFLKGAELPFRDDSLRKEAVQWVRNRLKAERSGGETFGPIYIGIMKSKQGYLSTMIVRPSGKK